MTEIVREDERRNAFEGRHGVVDPHRSERLALLVREAGFTIERDEVVTMQEPEGRVGFQWILARR
jgi:hypothetical protein